jgi:DNA-binding IclR family transcriptional regulator
MPEDRLVSVGRMSAILDYFIANRGDAGVTEVSRATGFSKSVVHRLLGELAAAGFLAVDEETRRCRLGFKSLQLGLAALSQIDLRRQALPYMRSLRSVTKETVNLSVRVGDRRVYIESMESPQEIRQRVELGRELVLYLGASSKAMLAFLEPAERERVLADAHDKVTAQRRALDTDVLRAELAGIRVRGYAKSLSERQVGAFSVAAPVFDRDERVIGSISISGPISRWRDELTEQYGELLLAEVGMLSRDLGSMSARLHPVFAAEEVAV